MENTKYELRNPKADDMFLMFRILSKVGVKNLKGCFQADAVLRAAKDANGEEAAASVGISVLFEIASVVIEHLEEAKNDIYAFLSKLSGMKTADISEMDAGEFAELLVEVVQLEGFRDFFQHVIRLFK